MIIREIIGQYRKRETRKKRRCKKKKKNSVPRERSCGTTRAKLIIKKNRCDIVIGETVYLP